MFQKFVKFISILGRLSVNTHIWCVSVVAGSILLVMSFIGPSDRQLAVANDDASLDNEIVIVEYSSVLGSISQLENLDYDSVDEITSIIPDENEAVVDSDDSNSLEDVSGNEEIKADEIAQAVADTVEKLSVSGNKTKQSINFNEYDWEEVELLERLVECEARSEDYKGKLLVANVVLNRMNSGYWGDSIEDVINAPGQFAPVTSGAVYIAEVSDITVDACINALNGVDISDGAMYFRKSEEKFWGDKEFLFRYGDHSFYK